MLDGDYLTSGTQFSIARNTVDESCVPSAPVRDAGPERFRARRPSVADTAAVWLGPSGGTSVDGVS
jgi:hypothetical protein